MRAGLAGNGHDHVRGPGEVDQLVEAVDGAQDRHGIGLGMEGEMPAPGSQARGSAMTRVDKPDDRRAAPRALAQPAYQAASVPPGPDQQNAAPGRRGDRGQRGWTSSCPEGCS